MALGKLEKVLARLRDGVAEPGDLAAIVALLAVDERISPELRQAALADLADDPEGTAAGLLAVLGADDLGVLLAAAVLEESGASDVADEVLGRLSLSDDLPVAPAVWDEAGEVDVREEVMEAVEPDAAGIAWSDLLGMALRDEAGGVDIADAVFAAIEEPAESTPAEAFTPSADDDEFSWPIAEAVLAECGEIDIAAAVMSAVGEARVPLGEAVRHAAGRVEVAAAVVEALGYRAMPVAAAVRAECGAVELADAVMEALDLREAALPLAEAVRAEAGEVDVTAAVDEVLEPAWVSALLDGELSQAAQRLAGQRLAADPRAGREMTAMAQVGRQLRAAVAAEAGPAPVLWSEVATAIGADPSDEVAGWDGQLLAEAVRAEAGEVDVAREVMGRVVRTAVAPAAVAEIPEPANRGWTWGAVALASVALFAVLVAQPWTSAPGSSQPALQFADAGEIVVDDLSYAEDAMVQVIQASDDDGAEALIIWVDEEALL